MQNAPLPPLNSCMLPNACKKIEIMKIKVKLNGYFSKKRWVASQPALLFTVIGSTS